MDLVSRVAEAFIVEDEDEDEDDVAAEDIFAVCDAAATSFVYAAAS